MAATLSQMVQMIGGSRSGWQTRAATVLGLSRRTVATVIAGGVVSDKTARTIRATYAAISKTAVREGASETAGRWAVGLPLTRTGDRETRDECVVSHLAEPAFSVHVTMRWGDKIPGDQIKDGKTRVDPTMRVTTISGDLTAAGKLIDQARKIAMDFIYQHQFSRGDVVMREYLDRHYANVGFTLQEAREAPLGDIIDTVDDLSREGLDAAHEVLDHLLASSLEPRRELGEMSDRDQHCYDAGLRAGRAEARATVLREILTEVERRRETVPGSLTLKREIAHHTTIRGGRQKADKAASFRGDEQNGVQYA